MVTPGDLEMEEVSLSMDESARDTLDEEKERTNEGNAPPKKRKVFRIVSKWMLPEKSRPIYLERANCFPPPLFIIFISLIEVSMEDDGKVWKIVTN